MKRFPERPLLLGHRGSPTLVRENTLDSFRAALEAGVDGVELDIHRTKDGVLAVHHDPSSKDLIISDVTWEELKSTEPHIPRLEEVIELIESYPNAYLNIELKSEFSRTDQREVGLAHLLRKWSHAAKSRTWISCFDPLAIIRLHKIDTELPLALLTSADEVLELIPCLPITGIHSHQAMITPERLQAWHSQGMFVFAWTVNDQDTAKDLVKWGVDGLIGDIPELLLNAHQYAEERSRGMRL